MKLTTMEAAILVILIVVFVMITTVICASAEIRGLNNHYITGIYK